MVKQSRGSKAAGEPDIQLQDLSREHIEKPLADLQDKIASLHAVL